MTEPKPPCPQAANSVTCDDCTQFLLDYIEGRLPEEQRFRFESHIAFCPDCEVFLSNYRKAVALASGSGRPAADEAPVPQALVDAILAARRQL